MSKKQARTKYIEFREEVKGLPKNARQDIREMLDVAYTFYTLEQYNESIRISCQGIGAARARKGYIEDIIRNLSQCRGLLDKGVGLGAGLQKEEKEISEIESFLRQAGAYD